MDKLQHQQLERFLRPEVEELLESEPVVVVNGARTAGKSTLLSALAERRSATVLDLDDLETRQAVASDPTLFAAGRSPVLVDEFQHVPELLDAIKAELNRDLRPGRFVLTGSTRYLTLPTASQSLAGRVHIATLWPMSQGELSGQRESFIDRVIGDPGALVRDAAGATETSRDNYVRRVLAGGFPLALARPDGSARARWFRDYLTTVLERDVLEIRKIRQRSVLPIILRQLAARTGGVLRLSDIARSLSLDANLVGDFVTLLEAVFLVQRLPAFGRTLNSRVTASPKIHLVDSGLAAYLAAITTERIAARDPAALTEFGHILETFVVNEVIKQSGWSSTYVTPGHFRTSAGQEVDLVLEAEDGRVAGIEIKSGGRVTTDDLKGLRVLRDRLGSQFVGGVVMHLGTRSYTPDDRIHVLPLARLWS